MTSGFVCVGVALVIELLRVVPRFVLDLAISGCWADDLADTDDFTGGVASDLANTDDFTGNVLDVADAIGDASVIFVSDFACCLDSTSTSGFFFNASVGLGDNFDGVPTGFVNDVTGDVPFGFAAGDAVDVSDLSGFDNVSSVGEGLRDAACNCLDSTPNFPDGAAIDLFGGFAKVFFLGDETAGDPWTLPSLLVVNVGALVLEDLTPELTVFVPSTRVGGQVINCF